MAGSDQALFNMLEQQLRPNEVLDETILVAMNSVLRADFCDATTAALAYADTFLPIGYDQYMLSPLLEGRMLQALAIRPQDTVLEIGTGSGYFTALLAQLAEHVVSVEIVPELSLRAAERLRQYQLTNVELQQGDAAQGWPLADRVDVIVLTGAVLAIADDYLQQLQVGGRLIAVTGREPAMTVQCITRVAEREWQTKPLFETVIPYLLNAAPAAEFEF